MAVGNTPLPRLFPVQGVRLGFACAGIKTPGRKDLTIIELADGAVTAGVFTRNRFCAAPVQVARQHLQAGNVRYWLINTGNANAGTAERGMTDCLHTCRALAEKTGISVANIAPFSTGVIGEFLPVAKIIAGMDGALSSLSDDQWPHIAEAIMTTDTRPKGASVQFTLDGNVVTITGITKGAGMIKPNMATMLSFIATDAEISVDILQLMLDEAVNRSFNRITIDGDTSTNDACMLAATGKSGAPCITSVDSMTGKIFSRHLQAVMLSLAQSIVRDGEGATKFVAVQVNGANNSEEALKIAYAVAESPLVKTALAASDPNWGRILAAAGRAGVDDLDSSNVQLFLDDVLVAEQGGRATSYTEAAGQAVMSRDEFTIRLELHRGAHSETVWTTDLTHDYVTINASYRT